MNDSLIADLVQCTLPAEPPGATAVALLELDAKARVPLVFVARDEQRAKMLQAMLTAFAPDIGVAPLPGWDCLPYDPAPPSPAVMGTRVGTLRWLTDRENLPRIVLTTPAGLLRRVAPQTVWEPAHIEFRVDGHLDLREAEERLERAGYFRDDRVDEPGEFTVRGRVLDLFPAAAPRPCRVEFEEGRITAIRSYEPHTQRSVAETDLLQVDPASELVSSGDDGLVSDGVQRLPDHYPSLSTLFDYVPECGLLVEPAAVRAMTVFMEQVQEGYQLQLESRGDTRAGRAIEPDKLFLTEGEWEAAVDRHRIDVEWVGDDSGQSRRVPRFAASADRNRDFVRFVAAERAEGRTVVLSAPSDRLLARMARALDEKPQRPKDWHSVGRADPATLLALAGPIEEGFRTVGDDIAVIAAADVFGAAAGAEHRPDQGSTVFQDERLQLGQPVVHLQHGVGILEGLDEATASPDEAAGEMIRLRYARGAVLMLPVEEVTEIWRYEADPETATLDDPKSGRWAERRCEVEAQISEAAARLLQIAEERGRRVAPQIAPPPSEYERFAGRFPYPLTPDQRAAIDATVSDLRSGRPMDRLVCGDVGYGKTEIALRAAAAAVFAGRQVAILVPTTVLARQHLETFGRRFRPFGIAVGELSRRLDSAEARKVKADLAAGELRIVIGTQALLGKGIRFADLGLVIVDEEQRFGADQKARFRDLAGDVHMLTMTATPIPRTLQAGLVGLKDVSVIATPPAARLPVRTVFAPYERSVVRGALLRERDRGGQSFVVCPRIADLRTFETRVREAVPELDIRVAHGKLPAAELDDTMVAFAGGEGDVLLATNIIESGLDIPRANTILVWRADRFGLSQLHQLRGRVGRARRRGVAYLLTDADRRLSPAAEARLRSFGAAEGLGAGFAISARDMQLRGAGDLFGIEQAGQVSLIGVALFRDLLTRAVAAARGEAVEDWKPELRLGVSGGIPKDHIPEDEVRLNLYRRIYAAPDDDTLVALEEELIDRFGPLPDPLRNLLEVVRIGFGCRRLGIERIDAGPKGVAASFRRPPGRVNANRLSKAGLQCTENRVLLPLGSDEANRLENVSRFVTQLAEALNNGAPGSAPPASA